MFGFFNSVKDPVCGMKVDKKTQFTAEAGGQKYFFCSANCQKQFNADSKSYTMPQMADMKHGDDQSCCH